MAAHYRDLRSQFYGKGAYNFDESALNSLGYRLLREGKPSDALRIFHLNAQFFPDSANVFDSLAEGYMEAGQPEQAVVYYQKSLQLDPTNHNAVEKLRQLRTR